MTPVHATAPEIVDTRNRHCTGHIEIHGPLVEIVARQVSRLPTGVVVTRHVRVAWTKRHPADLVLAKRNERHHRRRVNRISAHLVSHPMPAVADLGPTAVVIWRITPGLGRNPGWTIWIIRLPVTGLVGHPTSVDSRRPTVAVAVDVLPVAVVIKIIEAGNI